MEVGDLIYFEAGQTDDERHVGTVLRLDVYRGGECSVPLRIPEPIVEVLWNTGMTGWILSERVRVISESR